MRAAWYDRQGEPAEVLQVGDLPEAPVGPGEVRVALTRSGISPGDVKKRQAWLGSTMAYPRVVPHSDGAGTVVAVGEGVDRSRVGERVWVFGAQSYRAFGTAAESTVVPADRAVALPDGVTDEIGACLGIPGITAHRAVFADGPVAGQVVVVQGVLGSVGSLAAALARRAGATVIGTVVRSADVPRVEPGAVDTVVALDADPAAAIRAVAPDGVDRVVEVAFSANVELDAQVLRNGGVVAAYASPDGTPTFPFWPMLFDNLLIRLLGSDDFPEEARRQAVSDLTSAAAEGALSIPLAEVLPLEQIARAHELVEGGRAHGRVLLALS
ncbi:NADPH2:quinone reductase [Motilibacter rhizosphaerae]|uniref:NADPH2:quinone reductase n=1 Tax=Motilibacter rhizosphaerae TaxID=598652 RepID=A0A4Q7NAN0_9ACTN|nr:NADPH:quinone reductase [Motilibacter rhizosphaerae]RZS79946.1 NADPH2:quinone reductase [Motilibacter rhizosphaerae]